MKVVTQQKDLLDAGCQRVDEVARSRETRRRHQDAFVVLDSVLAALHVEVIDDVRVGHESDIKAVARRQRPYLTRPE